MMDQRVPKIEFLGIVPESDDMRQVEFSRTFSKLFTIFLAMGYPLVCSKIIKYDKKLLKYEKSSSAYLSIPCFHATVSKTQTHGFRMPVPTLSSSMGLYFLQYLGSTILPTYFFLILSKIPNLLFTAAFYSLGLLYCKHINYSNICITILPLPYFATVL